MKPYVFTLFLIFAVVIAGCHEEHAETDHHSAIEEMDGDVHSHGHEASNDPRPEKLELPEHLSTVLRKEMVELTDGMGVLLSHLAQGNAADAAEVAEKIHKSFILKQELSKADLKQLVGLLPEEFIEMDRTFHSNAAKIVEATHRKDFTTAIHLYGQMAQACIDCHGQYAVNRFPELAH